MSKWGKKDKSEEEKCKGWLTVLFPLKKCSSFATHLYDIVSSAQNDVVLLN
jgi:hypothetical protein